MLEKKELVNCSGRMVCMKSVGRMKKVYTKFINQKYEEAIKGMVK